MKLSCALFALAFSASPAFASTDFYLSSSVTGSCAAKSTTPGYIIVRSYGISGTDPAAGAKILLGDFVLSKRFDDCSGVLATQFLEARAIPTLTLTGTTSPTPGSAPITFLTITMTNAIIDGYSIGHDDESATEEIKFRYQAVCINSTPADGGKPTNVCYDSSTNRVTN